MGTPNDLFSAIWGGDTKRVGDSLKETPTLAATPDSKGMTPLLAATYARQPEVVDLLLAATCWRGIPVSSRRIAQMDGRRCTSPRISDAKTRRDCCWMPGPTSPRAHATQWIICRCTPLARALLRSHSSRCCWMPVRM
jgi:hypothetical protein